MKQMSFSLPLMSSTSRRILYATGEMEDLDIDEILRDGHLCLFPTPVAAAPVAAAPPSAPVSAPM